MTVGAQDEGTRLRERALRVASAAYGVAHGDPLEHAAATTGVRWRTGTYAVVAGAAVLAVLVGLVGARAVLGPSPEPTLAADVAPLGDAVAAGPDGTRGSGAPAHDDGAPAAPGGQGGPADVAGGGSVAPDGLLVHVVGAVHEPGVVRLPPGSRVVDAVELAGGPTPEADLAGLNLAREVRDGEQVRVPLPGEEVEEPAADVGGGAAPGATGPGAPAAPVDVNRATAAELETLPGIGPVLAERVVAHRTEHGPFATVEALTAVSGIGPRVLEGLRDLVVVG